MATNDRYRDNQAIPPKIDCRWSISTVGSRSKKKLTVDDQLREKSTVDDRLRKKKGRRRGKEEKKIKERIPRPRAVATRGLLATAFSLARGDGASPCARRKIEVTLSSLRLRPFFQPREETERLPAWGERSRQRRRSVSSRGEKDRGDVIEPAPAIAFSPARGDGASPCTRRKIEAISPIY
ncbi:hypothetical protein B296_00038159 [Ensete ventricosum]|uniref:Uncharacterized protein n=1 Tax=Ensete ventricosum TaxID=4639 RepID=A0A426Y0I9_ENSVE|nr:hypothetical protein B296_00038159 [Ensete ventricosum]